MVEANLKLALSANGRSFVVAIEMLKILKINKVNLLTNNPEKLNFFKNSRILFKKTIPLEIESIL